MANKLKREKKATAISLLCEGMSIRSIERHTDIHRDTIMRLGVRVGQGSTELMSGMFRNLNCERLQLDEMCGFVGKKQKHVKKGEKEFGNFWTFVAIDADTKLVPCFRVGKRDLYTTKNFLYDLAERVPNQVQITTDALRTYVNAVESSFGSRSDYAMLVKTYTSSDLDQGRYSPPDILQTSKNIISGNPDVAHISTSYVECQNRTMRMHCRRLARLTSAFSKKIENFKAAIGLHFAYYNLIKIHRTVRMTPAMAAGVVNTIWSFDDLLDAVGE